MDDCKFQIWLDDEELEGLDWIAGVLVAIRAKGPGHKNYRKAAALARALNKIQNHCLEMHGVAHSLEHKALELADIKMAIQPWGKA